MGQTRERSDLCPKWGLAHILGTLSQNGGLPVRRRTSDVTADVIGPPSDPGPNSPPAEKEKTKLPGRGVALQAVVGPRVPHSRVLRTRCLVLWSPSPLGRASRSTQRLLLWGATPPLPLTTLYPPQCAHWSGTLSLTPSVVALATSRAAQTHWAGRPSG